MASTTIESRLVDAERRREEAIAIQEAPQRAADAALEIVDIERRMRREADDAAAREADPEYDAKLKAAEERAAAATAAYERLQLLDLTRGLREDDLDGAYRVTGVGPIDRSPDGIPAIPSEGVVAMRRQSLDVQVAEREHQRARRALRLLREWPYRRADALRRQEALAAGEAARQRRHAESVRRYPEGRNVHPFDRPPA